MRKLFKIFSTVLLLFPFAADVYSQAEKSYTGPFVFADREYCISGDTLWYKVYHKNGTHQTGNVMHVQLTSADNRLISATHKKSTAGWAEGFIPVPDSLSSGVYFLSAFFNGYSSGEEAIIQKKSLFVYNRFQKKVAELQVPAAPEGTVNQNFQREVAIKPDKSIYKQREKVTASINAGFLHSAGIENIVVKAEYLDELATEAGGNFFIPSSLPQNGDSGVDETDGILIQGKVINQATGERGENVVMLLSLQNDPHYFDYSVTSPEGYFSFFLKDAYGEGEIILQAFSENANRWRVTLHTGKIDAKVPVHLENRLLTPGQSEFIEKLVDASFYSRLFEGHYVLEQPVFEMPSRFDMPFYGNPYHRVVLSDFIELPDFQEVSRELLHGVQYRRREDEIKIRLLNMEANEYFEDQPFRLINGIPVFKNSLLDNLGSEDIEYIDYVLEDRVYGDLRFRGVLALYLKEKSNDWIAGQPNLFRLKVPLLQPDASPSYMNTREFEENIPDLRRVFYWQLHSTKEPLQFEFLLSDMKGKVKISAEGVNKEGRMFNVSEIIEIE